MINSGSKQPIIYLIRHARSVYNQAQADVEQKLKHISQSQLLKTPQYLEMKFENKELEDCDITQDGYKQCVQCRQKMKYIDVDLIIVSPLRRALTTCFQVFKNHKSQAPVIVDPLFRQIFESICDIGSKLRQSMRDYPDFDYSLIENPDYWYVQSIQNQKEKNLILEKLKKLNSESVNQQAKIGMLRYLKQMWEKRKKSADFKAEVLSPIGTQKQKLKMLLQKYNSIAIVTHSQNIKSYTGIKPPNCSIMIYKPEYFDLPISQVPHQYL